MIFQPKYIVVNNLTGYVAFNGRRFWSIKGAIRKIRRSPFPSFLSVRRLLL